MAIKRAELFSPDPAHAFDFEPVAPSAIFNQGLMPRFNAFAQQWAPEEETPEMSSAVQQDPPQRRAMPPIFDSEEETQIAPRQPAARSTGIPADPVTGNPVSPQTPDVDYSAAVSDTYQDPADFVFQSEARMKNGKLQVYAPPSGDGGGAYEVAGITARYQPKEAARLKALIDEGRNDEAAAAARDFYRQRAAPFTRYTDNKGIQLQITDTVHHRGEGGLRSILQRATGSDTKSYQQLVTELSARPDALDAFHKARQDYEWEEVDRGRASREKFRKGLQNRFNKANAAARQFL
jgi:hypothetical protein